MLKKLSFNDSFPRSGVIPSVLARFSTNKQSPTSIDDQVRQARDFARDNGIEIAIVYADAETSAGIPFERRAAGKQLLEDARAGKVNLLIIEGLDRMFRDLGEQERTIKLLEFHGVRIVGLSDEYDTIDPGRKLLRLARGMINEFGRDDVTSKTQRGLRGSLSRDLSTGGKCYGYKTVKVGRDAVLAIDEDQAEHVRYIFGRYGEGASARSIIFDLNERGVPGPSGGLWGVSAMVGDRKRGTGMLNNEIYVGKRVFNRCQWVRHPETGQRTRRERPKSDWVIHHSPQLRIVDQESWDAVRARERKGGPGKGAAVKTLFSKMLICAECGGPFTAINATRYGCNRRKDRGPLACGNDVTIHRVKADAAILEIVQDELISEAGQRALRDSVDKLTAEEMRDAADGTGSEKRRKQVEKQLANVADATAKIGLNETLQQKLLQLTDELGAIKAEQSRASGLPKLDADKILAECQATIARVNTLLLEHPDRGELRRLLFALLGPLTVRRNEEGNPEVAFCEPVERLPGEAIDKSLGLVAGAGFEPTTFGL